MKKLFLTGLLAFSFSALGEANKNLEDYTETGNVYLTWSENSKFWYFHGVNSSINVYEVLSIGNYCIPSKATIGQAHEILNKYIKDNPNKAHKGIKELIILSKIKAFPCKEKD